MSRHSELDKLMHRWDVLSREESLPEETRRVLRICLDDVRRVLAPEIETERRMSREHLSGEHDE